MGAAKADWRRRRRSYRPWLPEPGQHLVIDWGRRGRLHMFCAVLAWSRYRFVRFGSDETLKTTLALLAESSRSWERWLRRSSAIAWCGVNCPESVRIGDSWADGR